MADEEWVEAGNKPDELDESLLQSIDLDDLRLTENKRYVEITKTCQTFHKELLEYERKGKLGNYIENPSLIGDYLGKLRLNANMLFGFINIYIDILSDLQQDYARERKDLYDDQLLAGKSPSAAEKHAREVTRVSEAKIGFVENSITQIKNEYERYNGICMYLQSRMKEFNTEKVMG